MKQIFGIIILLGLLSLVMFTGCEGTWKSTDDDNYWDSSVSWANFSGTYRSSAGSVSVTVSNGVVVPIGGLAEIRDEIVGVGNGVDKTFSGTLDGKPVFAGSLTITDGTESFEDNDEDGILTGDKGGTGAISYDTGVFSVTFLLQPAPNVDVAATYIYYVGGDDPIEPDDPDDATSKTITRLTVLQDGNVLIFTDEDGDQYRGKMGRLATTGGDDTGTTSGTIIGNFEVTGANGITFVGTFEGTYTSPDSESGALNGTLVNRYIRGTWILGDDTGNIDFAASGD